ncbi:MAG: hypothetical protein JW994_05385 [Candidatus Omnitrophica bacterium]|nr:hypothetical protein [Candidatus Omnitrophota bacterium]
MEKIRYEPDPYSRFVLCKSGRKSVLPKFRKVLDGRFRTGGNNELSYHIKYPVHGGSTLSKESNIPHQFKLRGRWSLTDNHDLRFTMDKHGRETFGDQITLAGEIIDARADSLSFAVTTRTKTNIQSTYILNLAGTWKADENNRLTFRVKREEGKHDILTFNGLWEVNKNHQIVYEYEKADLIRKKKKIRKLTFKGFWDIKDSLRMSYVLSAESDSMFRFRASAARLEDKYIKYELGIGLTAGTKPVKRTVTLYGKWKIKSNIGLVFETEYCDKEVHAIVFGAEARLTPRNTVSFKIKNDIENRSIGMDVELSRKIFKDADGEAFLRLLKSKRESAVYAGAVWRW